MTQVFTGSLDCGWRQFQRMGEKGSKEEIVMGLAGEGGKVGRCGQILEDLPWSLL